MFNRPKVESVERVIAAPPATIFALLADASRHPEFDGSGTVRKARDDGNGQLTLGSRFGMDMKMGLNYSMTNTIVEYEPDRQIAWQTTSSVPVIGKMIGGRIWRYVLEPVPGGTKVTESWDISKERLPLVVEPLRGRTRKSMAATLERIETLVT
jgi:uncharacterized protein YndB with AHSA1/START domain